MAPDVTRTKLSESLVAHYVRAIVSHTVGPGQPLPAESAIAAQFGVSKPIVRESLQVLASIGMVSIQHGKRTVAMPEASWDVLDRRVQQAFELEGRGHELNEQLYEARLILETNAAQLAAKRASANDAEELRALVAEMDAIAHGSRDLDAFLRMDRAFHERVAEASGNRVVRHAVREVNEFLTAAWSRSSIEPDELPYLVKLHARIAATISEGDSDGAARAVDFHLTRAANKASERHAHEQAARTTRPMRSRSGRAQRRSSS